MNNTMKEWEVQENPNVVIKVWEAQIKQLYKQSWIGLVGVFVVAISICIALWQLVPSWKLALWMSIFTLITFLRAYLIVAFQRKAPAGIDIRKWAKWHVFGTSASGLMWALPSFFLWPENSPEYQMIWALCLLPLCASAVSTYHTWKPSYLSFLLLSAIPVSLRFFYEGGMIYTILGFLTLFFIFVMVQAGSLMHVASLRLLRAGFRNEALSSFLTKEKAKEEELTQQLQKAHDQLHEISLTDELTGLGNRRYLNSIVKTDIAQVLRKYRNLNQGLEKNNSNINDIVFTMIDLDHFKVINDTS
ncbi:MAG: GGDEF domain-containing protein [Gammaproteobacteria bacterium]|nr:GGDEF domain-containing protein [Gammaproteobacteria bacterium]